MTYIRALLFHIMHLMRYKVRGYSDVYKGSTIPYNAPHEVR